MTKVWKNFYFSALLLVFSAAALLFPNSRAFAAEFKKVAVVSTASADLLKGGIASGFKQAGYEDTFNAFEMLLDQKYGIDFTRPAGACVLTDDKDFVSFGFLPIENFEEFYTALKEKYEDFDEETKEIAVEGKDVVLLIEKGEWIYVTAKKFADKIPADADPLPLLEGMNDEYLIGIRVYFGNLSEDLLQSLMAPVRQKIAASETDTAQFFESCSEIIDYGCRNWKTITFGTKIDSETGNLTFTYLNEPKEGSSLAETAKNNVDQKTLWSDLYQPEGSVLTACGAQKNGPEEIEFQKKEIKSNFESSLIALDEAIENLESDEEAQDKEQGLEFLNKAKNNLTSLQDFICENIDTGKSDGAMLWRNDGFFVAGISIVDGSKLNQIIKSAVDDVKEIFKDNDDKEIKELINQIKSGASYNGYTVSTFVVTDKMVDGEMKQNSSVSEVAFLLGVKEDAVLFVAGPSKKKVSQIFKEKADLERNEIPVPKESLIFSVSEIGNLLKNLGIDADDEDFVKICDQMAAVGADAQILGTQEISEKTIASSLIIKGGIFKLVGEVIRGMNESSEDDDSVDEDEILDEEE